MITLSIIKPLNKLSDIKTKKLAEFFNETLGFCPNSVLTMQKKPNLAEAFINLNKAVMENNGSLTPEFKRLIAFISSSAAGCRYCQAHTSLAAKRYGSSDKRLKAVWDYENSDLFSKKEKIALKFTWFPDPNYLFKLPKNSHGSPNKFPKVPPDSKFPKVPPNFQKNQMFFKFRF